MGILPLMLTLMLMVAPNSLANMGRALAGDLRAGERGVATALRVMGRDLMID